MGIFDWLFGRDDDKLGETAGDEIGAKADGEAGDGVGEAPEASRATDAAEDAPVVGTPVTMPDDWVIEDAPDAAGDGVGDDRQAVAEEAVEALQAVWEADDAAMPGDADTQPADGAEGAQEAPQGAGEGVSAGVAPQLRNDPRIEPLCEAQEFACSAAAGGMLGSWLLRAVVDGSLDPVDGEPSVELYDGEDGSFVADYWVSRFCDNSGEREGQGLACRGAEKRYRIAYDDLVGMQGLMLAVPGVGGWLAAHEGNMPDHENL